MIIWLGMKWLQLIVGSVECYDSAALYHVGAHPAFLHQRKRKLSSKKNLLWRRKN